MVVFVCSSCNESLRKNNVESHFFRCRNCRHVSCMDCNKEFDKISFKSHTSCISESEKYDKGNHTSGNKGQVKQDNWIEKVRAAIRNCNPNDGRLRGLLQSIEMCSNVPRKKSKFENFMKSKYHHVHPQLVQRIWELLSVGSMDNIHSQNTSDGNQNGPPSKKIRRNSEPLSSFDADHCSEADENVPDFAFKKEISRILSDVDGFISFRDLRKTLYSLYKSSASASSALLTKKEFKQKLKSVIQDDDCFSFSLKDGSFSEDVSPTAVNGNSVDFIYEETSGDHIESPICEAESTTTVSIDRNSNLTDFILSILNFASGRMHLEDLRKQLCTQYSASKASIETPLSEKQIFKRLKRKLNRKDGIQLSSDGVWVELMKTV